MHLSLYIERVAGHIEKLGANKTLIAVGFALSVSSTYAEEVPDLYSLEAPAYYYNKAVETCPSSEHGQDTACLKKLLERADQDLDAVYKGRFSFLPKIAVCWFKCGSTSLGVVT